MFGKKKPQRELVRGNGRDAIPLQHTLFETLNYTPVPYGFLTSWLDFRSNTPELLRKTASSMQLDALNAGADTNGDRCVFDPLLRAAAEPARQSGQAQYLEHLTVINHQDSLLRGEVCRAERMLKELQEERSALQEELNRFTETEKGRKNG